MFSTVDIVFSVIVLIFLVSGMIKGFVAELFGKISFILGILFAVLLNGKTGALFSRKIANEYISRIVAFVLVFAIVFVVLKIIQVILQKVFTGEVFGSLDKALGVLLGLAEGLVIVAFVIYIMRVQPWFDFSSLLDESFFGKMFSGILKSSEGGSAFHGSGQSSTTIPGIR